MSDEKTTAQTVLNLGGWSTRTVIYVALALFLIGAGFGAWGYHTWTHSDWLTRLHDMENRLTAEKNKPPIIKEVVRTQTQTAVEYVPKETVVYRDSKTGRELTAQELDSMNLNVRPSDFYFTVNGKPQKFSKTADERWAFDKNKLVVTQTATASIDIKVPTIDKTKRWGIGGIVSNKGAAPIIEYRAGPVEFGGFYGVDFYGGKISIRF